MTKTIKQRWQAMVHGQPGQRFQARYAAARESRADASWAQRGRRTLRLLLALVSIVIAMVLMFTPGPAVLFYLIAGTLLASELLFLAKLMDRGEVLLRSSFRWCRDQWKELPTWSRAVLVVFVVGLGVAGAYLSYRLVTN